MPALNWLCTSARVAGNSKHNSSLRRILKTGLGSMANLHPVRWSVNLFIVYIGRSRIQQLAVGHKHRCLLVAHVDIHNLPSADKKKTLNHHF